MKHIFKFKPLPDSNLSHNKYVAQMGYIEDIIKNNRLYMPKRQELNDPAEGLIMPDIFLSIMGSGIYAGMKQHHPTFNQYIDKYRVLSLTTAYDSFLMWAHYTNNYSGICFVFKSDDTFSCAEKIEYLNERPKGTYFEPDMDELFEIVKKALLRKNISWEYEEEHRIIQNEVNDFFNFKSTEIEGIILGHKVSEENEQHIKGIIEKYNSNINLYKTHIDEFDLKLLILPLKSEVWNNFGSGEDISSYAVTFEI